MFEKILKRHCTSQLVIQDIAVSNTNQDFLKCESTSSSFSRMSSGIFSFKPPAVISYLADIPLALYLGENVILVPHCTSHSSLENIRDVNAKSTFYTHSTSKLLERI